MAKWTIDPTHSEVLFKVKHLVISNVTGSFNVFEGAAETGADDFSDAKITFSANVDSIDTNQAQRDAHLKSADFFDVANFPKLEFTSTSFSKKGDREYILKGDLTLHGVTKPVELAVEYGGTAKDPYGQTKAGFEVTGKLNRSEYGLTWNAATEAGGVVVSDEVKLLATVQVIKQA
ncbi:MAG: YceI family protein [Bacteroidetes bacterium]|nr:YceI family protein [Bacteroidota bacterium]